ncbi:MULTISPECIES: histidine phosphatase family protein [Giesbergeria]|uniref:Histidine phosphatase family protein n=1 Tax=Giesbergeria sinuosa TaxID=80883 RepID=A0ABV9QGG2_9BURK
MTALLLTSGGAVAADVPIPPPAHFRVIPANKSHVQLLRRGGLVLYMRHGATDARIPDQIPVKLDDCQSQRPLTDAGRTQLDQIKGFISRLRLPYNELISSPFCRAVESARRVFGASVQIDPELRYTATMPEAEKKPAVARTRHWLSRKVSTAGHNRVVVAHGPNIAELMDYLPPEATLILFRPLGGSAHPGFEYIASIEPSHWPQLLSQLETP